MKIIVCIVVLGVAWFYIGLICLAAMDVRDWGNSELVKWADKCPIGGIFTIAMIWPVIMHYRNRAYKEWGDR